MTSPVGIGFTGIPFAYRDTLELVKLADEKGLRSAWMAEDYFTKSSPVVLGAWASQTHKIQLATGILPLFTRHVALSAMTMATLDEISGGRSVFGLGFGLTPLMTINMGFQKPPAITAIKEYVITFRKILAGENVTIDGKYVKCKNVKLQIKPLRDRIPVFIAANQRRMLRLAGEIADGVLLTAGTTPEHVRYAYEQIMEGARFIGRSADEIQIAGFVLTAVSNDKKFNAFNDIPLLRILAAYCISGEYGELIAELSGYDKSLLPKIREALAIGDTEKAGSFVNAGIANTMSALGTPEEVKDRLREFVRAGNGKFQPIIFLVGGDLKLGVETAAEITD